MKHSSTNKANPESETPADQQYQQILFADNELETAQGRLKDAVEAGDQQILFKNQDYLPVEEAVELPVAIQASLNKADQQRQNSRKPRWLWRIAVTLLAVVIAVETTDFFINGFATSPILTSIYGVILSCLLLLASSALLREWSTLRQFKRRQKLKQQAEKIIHDTPDTPYSAEQAINTTKIVDFCQQITNSLPCDLVSEQEKAWQAALLAEHSDNELLQLYSRLVLTKVDEKALREIGKFSTESVVLIALSPVAIIDMLIMLWRNLRMVNKIAGLYGLKLGYWSRIKLIRQVFVNMVYAGASELIADFGTEMLGADLLGKLSGRLAQGLGAGMLTARLGIKTMQLCRPITFDDQPKLSQVRKEMLTTIKALLIKR